MKLRADYIKGKKHAIIHCVPNVSSLSLFYKPKGMCEAILCLLYVKVSQSEHPQEKKHSGDISTKRD
jgi:hypothetical protein